MGNVASRPDEGASLYLRDQGRFAISSLSISSPRRPSAINVTPGGFPAANVTASRSEGDPSPVEYVQDPESINGPPSFLLKLTNDDEIHFKFTFIIRQTQPHKPSNASIDTNPQPLDTRINALTYVYASSPKEVETLVTREFHADPNLHKNANVALVGDYGTDGSQSVTFEWTWKWKPPKNAEDKGGGWRNSCSFVEYDPNANRFDTLASFSYWVANPLLPLSNPTSPLPFLLASPPKPRAVSSQTVDSRMSTADHEEPASPLAPLHEVETTGASVAGSVTTPQPAPIIKEPVRVDVACPKPMEDVTVANDGPVFRATIKALEQKTGNMRSQLKRVLKRAEQAHNAQLEANDAVSAFMDALRDASTTNANAVQPVIEHYFDQIAREILAYRRRDTTNLQKIIIDPLHRLYVYDIKQADSKKRDFEEESKDYYSYVSRYLGQRQDSVKTKKLAESDSKYQTKRRNFELKRFDYSSFMQDLHGGRKDQEILSNLTKYADAQTSGFLETAKKIDLLLPQLEALSSEVLGADKEYQYQRREREEKRRGLEQSNLPYMEPDPSASAPPPSSNGGYQSHSDTELGRADSTGSQLRSGSAGGPGTGGAINAAELSRSPGSLGLGVGASPGQTSKFKGIRDLEERDYGQRVNEERAATHRKEGLLWALSRPGSHVDPRAQLKAGWHKFWIVLDQGKLSEYSNWKQKLDLHMDPIDLRMASVREARNAERRFCFEVITPNYKRVYQATSEEDMSSWIVSINNALQSAVEGRGLKDKPEPSPAPMSSASALKRDIGSILTGKGHHSHSSSHNFTGSNIPSRRTTVGNRPQAHRRVSSSYDEDPDKLLQMLRDNDQGNCWCADCGSGSKVEWVSINLAIIVCIECSGIHRSLGTHISKVRSLTLDITSFTSDIIELLLLIGNRVSNMTWEAKLDAALKPTPQVTREQRLKFITAKYVDQAYVEPLSPTLSRYPSADDTLLAAIKKNDIQQVVYALALKANPNITDKSRGTHAIYLALAAADPASPSAVSTGQPNSQDYKAVAFPVAELLIQNGAEIPSSPPAFPLSRSAQQYVEQKRGRATGFGSEGLSPTPSSASLTHEQRLQREKEARLQKRVSMGGRLAKSPIPER